MLRRIQQIGCTLLALVFCLTTGPAFAQGTIKIAYTDPLSGPFAQVGDQNLQQFKYIIDWINARGGALGKKFELVAFDNKSQPSDALLALKSATDQNMPIIMQCSGSNIAAALIEAVEKHNERNPDNRIIYVNCGAVATELTNEKCSYWHFRMDAHVGMKAETMARALPKDVTKVYLLNQDYLFGQSVQRDVKAFLAKLRPDVQGGGRRADPARQGEGLLALHHQDQGVGRPGADDRQLGPGHDAADQGGHGLRARRPVLHDVRAPRWWGHGDRARGQWQGALGHGLPREHRRRDGQDGHRGLDEAVPRTHNFDFYAAGFRTIFEFIQAAMNKAKSSDPAKFAQALEGLTITDMLGHQVTMRKDDHQILSEYFVGVFTKGVKYDSERTGLGWKTEVTVPAKDLDQPNTCKMKRPA